MCTYEIYHISIYHRLQTNEYIKAVFYIWALKQFLALFTAIVRCCGHIDRGSTRGTSGCTCHSLPSRWPCGDDTFLLEAALYRKHGICPAGCWRWCYLKQLLATLVAWRWWCPLVLLVSCSSWSSAGTTSISSRWGCLRPDILSGRLHVFFLSWVKFSIRFLASVM